MEHSEPQEPRLTAVRTSLVKPDSISIILSTYNAPEWLEKSLWGFAIQTTRPLEILVADDGSDHHTRDVIDSVRSRKNINVKHVWHQDEGFRKCVILNRAIAQSSGEYLIFSDGDCVPRADFVSQHLQHAKVGHFLSGGYNKLPLELSQQIQLDDIESGRAFRTDWLRANGYRFSSRAIRLHTHGLVAQALNHLTTTHPTWNGHNASGWKSDLVKVNGFDERMRYGGEDCELGERLVHAGIRPIQIRFSAVCLHLDHERGYVNDADLHRNEKIRKETRANRATTTRYGLSQSAPLAA
ncbi:glycosyltransferase family 2 protein [Rhodopirellula sp.]|jgi:glycosyltransferase involved in cell wall biosynthesis|nr:glycosyltransferase family 2 protein [Rhodopirellula sp.]